MIGIITGEWYRSRGIPMYYVDNDRDEYWKFLAPDEINDDDSDEKGWLAIKVHEIINSENSGILVVLYRQWYAPDGEPISRKPKRHITSLTGLKTMIRKRGMTLWIKEFL